MRRIMHGRFGRMLSLALVLLMVAPSLAMAASDNEKKDAPKPIVISNVPGEYKISIGKSEETRVGTKGIISRDGNELAKFEVTAVDWGYSTVKISDLADGKTIMVGDFVQVTEVPAPPKIKKKDSGKTLGVILLIGALIALASGGHGGGGGGGSSSPSTSIILTSQSATLPANGTSQTTITATIRGANNALVADGTAVTFAASAGQISPESATTTDGVATATLTSSTTAGSCTVTSTANGASATTTVTFSDDPGATQGSIVLTSNHPSIQVLGSGGQYTQATISTTCRDGQGNLATSGTVNFSTTLGSVTGSGTINASGVATTTLVSNQTGEAQVTATWAAGEAEATISITVTPGPPHSVIVECTPGAIQCDGNSFATVTATVKDIAGNNVTDGTVVALSVQADISGGGNGTVTPESHTADGVATALLFSKDGNGDVSIPGTATVIAQVRTADQPEGIPAPTADIENHTTQVQFISQDVEFINIAATDHNIRGWDFINNTTNVMAIAYDSHNNPVPDGTAVYFTADHGMIRGDSGTAGRVAMSLTVNGLASATLVSDASGDGSWNGWVDVTATCGDKTVTTNDLVCFSGRPYLPNCSVEIVPSSLAPFDDSADVVVIVHDINDNPVDDDYVVELSTSKGTISPASDGTAGGLVYATLKTSTSESEPTPVGDGTVRAKIYGLPSDGVFSINAPFTVAP